MYEVHADRRKPNGVVGCYFAENLETNDANSVTCFVGSCRVSSNNVHKLPHCVSIDPIKTAKDIGHAVEKLIKVIGMDCFGATESASKIYKEIDLVHFPR